MALEPLKPKIARLISESTTLEDTLLAVCRLLKSQVPHYDWVGF